METKKDPFETIRAMLHETLEKVAGATKSYLDMLEKTLRAFPGANQDQISTLLSGKLQPTETSWRSF